MTVSVVGGGVLGVVGGHVDTTAPGAPSNLTASPGETSVVLTWNENTEPDLDHYEWRRDGGVWTSTTMNSAVADGLIAGTAYTFDVRAVDAAGNPSAPSTVDTGTTGGVTPPAATTQAGSVQGTMSNPSVTLPEAITPGSILIARVTCTIGDPAQIGALAGWEQFDQGNTSAMSWKLFRKIAAVGEPQTISATVAGASGTTLQVVEVRDRDTVDRTAAAGTAEPSTLLLSAGPTSPTTTSYQLAVSFFSTHGNPGTVTVGDGFSQINSSVRTRIATKVLDGLGQVATSSYSYTTPQAGSVYVVTVAP